MTDNEAKRVIMKKLGGYNGNIVDNSPVQIPESLVKTIYKNRAVKRAKRLVDLPKDDKKKTLFALGLQENATVQEVAEMLGYEK